MFTLYTFINLHKRGIFNPYFHLPGRGEHINFFFVQINLKPCGKLHLSPRFLRSIKGFPGPSISAAPISVMTSKIYRCCPKIWHLQPPKVKRLICRARHYLLFMPTFSRTSRRSTLWRALQLFTKVYQQVCALSSMASEIKTKNFARHQSFCSAAVHVFTTHTFWFAPTQCIL